MNQRALAAFLAVPLVGALVALAVFVPLPYTTYGPGPTVDVLGVNEGEEIVQIGDGQQVYRDDGELWMTTVRVRSKDADLNLFEAMRAWLDPDDAVYPKSAVYPDDKSAEEVREEGQIQMVSAQDTAAAVALDAIGQPVTPALEITRVQSGEPADGLLEVRDLIRAVDGEPLSDDINEASQQLREAVAATPPGEQITLTVIREGEQIEVQITPHTPSSDNGDGEDDSPRIGVFLGQGYLLPFEVTIDISSAIGGPSAGLMFSLAIFDTLTPGSLTGGGRVAGTGEIAPDGTVGPIGGIQQKIVGAREAGAELFLVPAENCGDVAGADRGDMRLARVDTFDTARSVIEAWAEDRDATLQGC